jgi:signal transduction histidine kinase
MRLSEENRAVNLMSSYVSHEMLTPLRCMDQVTKTIIDDQTTNDDHSQKLRIISQTIQFLLSNVKDNLDLNMLKAN